MGYSIISHINKRKENNMYLIVSRLKFTHSNDHYFVESQDKDEATAHKKKQALELLNTEEDKSFHLVTVI
jgi:hypothetical protein